MRSRKAANKSVQAEGSNLGIKNQSASYAKRWVEWQAEFGLHSSVGRGLVINHRVYKAYGVIVRCHGFCLGGRQIFWSQPALQRPQRGGAFVRPDSGLAPISAQQLFSCLGREVTHCSACTDKLLQSQFSLLCAALRLSVACLATRRLTGFVYLPSLLSLPSPRWAAPLALRPIDGLIRPQ